MLILVLLLAPGDWMRTHTLANEPGGPAYALEFDGSPETVDGGEFWPANTPLGHFYWTARVRPDGGGWDAFAASMTSDGVAEFYRRVDVDHGDALFDVAMLPSGRYLALGTTGYVQNPSGASISEETQPLLVLLDTEGSAMQRISVADGPRQDQLRSIASLNGRWLIGGMRNGPGTHSGDGQPALITADGFLLEMAGLPMQ